MKTLFLILLIAVGVFLYGRQLEREREIALGELEEETHL